MISVSSDSDNDQVDTKVCPTPSKSPPAKASKLTQLIDECSTVPKDLNNATTKEDFDF